MRTNIIIIGLVVTLGGASLLFDAGGPFANPPGPGGVLTTGMGLLDLALGILISKPTKVTIPPEGSSGPKISVDRGVTGASVYQLSFFADKLVMKRLATSKVTILLGLALALAGVFLESNLFIGAAGGGLTGYVLQELFTQQRRSSIMKGRRFEPNEQGDIRIPYSKISKAFVQGNHMTLLMNNRPMRVNFPRGYTRVLSLPLAKLLPRQYEKEVTRPKPSP